MSKKKTQSITLTKMSDEDAKAFKEEMERKNSEGSSLDLSKIVNQDLPLHRRIIGPKTFAFNNIRRYQNFPAESSIPAGREVGYTILANVKFIEGSSGRFPCDLMIVDRYKNALGWSFNSPLFDMRTSGYANTRVWDDTEHDILFEVRRGERFAGKLMRRSAEPHPDMVDKIVKAYYASEDTFFSEPRH